MKNPPYIFLLLLLSLSCQKKKNIEIVEPGTSDAATFVSGTYHPARVSFYWRDTPAHRYDDSLKITKLSASTVELSYYITSVTDGPHPNKIYKVERKDEATYDFFDLGHDPDRPRFSSKNGEIAMQFADGIFAVSFARKKK